MMEVRLAGKAPAKIPLVMFTEEKTGSVDKRMADGKVTYDLGLGKKKERTVWTFRKAVAALLRAVEQREKAVAIPAADEDEIRSVAQLAHLSLYRYEMKKEKTKSVLGRVVIVTDRKADAAVRREAELAGLVMAVRDLVNMPPNIITPSYMLSYARRLAKRHGFSVESKETGQFPLLTAVGKGSKEKPVMMVMRYTPKRSTAKRPIALVGKGITFDSGGLGIKLTLPGNYMRHMKLDMSGAASVIHAVAAAAMLRLDRPVIGITPMCENMPSGTSYRIDDVYRSFKGRTVEIVHTDAEGRLVLADGIELATTYRPEAIIDIATLTGATLVATGPDIAPVMGNDQGLVDEIKAAAALGFEKVWQLPLEPDYREALDSDIADIKNLNEYPQAGTIIGGLFLQTFADDFPWAHIDIGTAAWRERPCPETISGATALGTRTLIQFLIGRS